MKVVCQDTVFAFAVNFIFFFFKMLKSGKGSRKSCRNVLGENILYRKNLSLAKEGSVLKAYTYFKK